MRNAREIAHESAEREGNELCPSYGHATACDEMTAAIRAAQIDALRWTRWMLANGRAVTDVIRARIAELEADAVRPVGEVERG